MHVEQRREDSDGSDLLVYVLDGHSVDVVASELQSMGAIVERSLPLSGMIGIRAARSRIGELQRVKGVKLIREAGHFQLPPFSEDFPQ